MWNKSNRKTESKVVEQQDAKAKYNTGVMYARQNNYKEAVKWFKLAAEQGDPEAQCDLGVCFIQGKGVDKNDVEAEKYLLLSSNQGNTIAQNNLGGLYYRRGEIDEAFEWYNKAIANGNQTANRNMNAITEHIDKTIAEKCSDTDPETKEQILLALGREFEKIEDYNNAELCFLKVAVQNKNVEAQYHLGLLYYRTKKYKKSIRWYSISAENGFAWAQCNLGGIYMQGSGVEQDFDKAEKYFTMAANQGDTMAQNNLTILQTFKMLEKQGVKPSIETRIIDE